MSAKIDGIGPYSKEVSEEQSIIQNACTSMKKSQERGNAGFRYVTYKTEATETQNGPVYTVRMGPEDNSRIANLMGGMKSFLVEFFRKGHHFVTEWSQSCCEEQNCPLKRKISIVPNKDEKTFAISFSPRLKGERQRAFLSGSSASSSSSSSSDSISRFPHESFLEPFPSGVFKKFFSSFSEVIDGRQPEEKEPFILEDWPSKREDLISPFQEIRSQPVSFPLTKTDLPIEIMAPTTKNDFLFSFLAAFRGLFGESFSCPIFFKRGVEERCFFAFHIPPLASRRIPEIFFFFRACFPWNMEYVQRSPTKVFLEEVAPKQITEDSPELEDLPLGIKIIFANFEKEMNCFMIRFSSGTVRYLFCKTNQESFTEKEKKRIQNHFPEIDFELGDGKFVIEPGIFPLAPRKFPEFLRPVDISPSVILSTEKDSIDSLSCSRIVGPAFRRHLGYVKVQEITPEEKPTKGTIVYKLNCRSDERTFPLRVCKIQEDVIADCATNKKPYVPQIQMLSSSEAVLILAELQEVEFSQISQESFQKLGGTKNIQKVAPPARGTFQYSIAFFPFGTLLIIKSNKGTFLSEKNPLNFRMNKEKTILNIYSIDFPRESFFPPLNPFSLYSISPGKVFTPNSLEKYTGEKLIYKFYKFWNVHVKTHYPKAEMACVLGGKTTESQDYIFHICSFIVEELRCSVFLFQKMFLKAQEGFKVRVFEIDEYSFMVRLELSNPEPSREDSTISQKRSRGEDPYREVSLSSIEEFLQGVRNESPQMEEKIPDSSAISKEVCITQVLWNLWEKMLV